MPAWFGVFFCFRLVFRVKNRGMQAEGERRLSTSQVGVWITARKDFVGLLRTRGAFVSSRPFFGVLLA